MDTQTHTDTYTCFAPHADTHGDSHNTHTQKQTQRHIHRHTQRYTEAYTDTYNCGIKTLADPYTDRHRHTSRYTHGNDTLGYMSFFFHMLILLPTTE